jgi:ribonucleoside-diphosphate reductase alpha chain
MNAPLQLARRVEIDPTGDDDLTDFGKRTLASRYAQEGEGPQDIFARVATAYGDTASQRQRLYNYMRHGWFMPSTPVLTNGGRDGGLPISCYLNGVDDSMAGIQRTWNENTALGSNGGGIGTYWGGVRSVGEKVRGKGQTSGIIPFIRVMDSLTMAISQGDQRRGAAAVYLDISHPEVEEFLEIRKPNGGDLNRKALYLHHGIGISDAFMEAVRDNKPWDLVSPKDGSVRKTVDAFALWAKILDTRLATGEPYLVFTDTATRTMAQHQRELGLRVRQSNLCAEIMLHAGRDHLNNERTAVCCLASVNAEKYMEWKDSPFFILDVMTFLDNVLEDFIQSAPPEMANAVYSARRERSVGLGLMGFHSFLQQQGVPFDSLGAKAWNLKLFKHLRRQADAANVHLGAMRGPNPDWAEWAATAPNPGEPLRFSHCLSIAPTASISIICGGTSAGIDPIPANVYTHKTLNGSTQVRNPYLERELERYGRNDDDAWASILHAEGSCQHLEFLPQEVRDCYKTEFEIDQRWIVELAADRAPEVCQSQSVNVFLPADVEKWDLHMLHFTAWERGLKSLYYLRSKSIRRGAVDGNVAAPEEFIHTPPIFNEYPECLACQ